MQVKVPKFIEIEDKIAFGMTWKQFLALGVGLGGGAIAYTIFEPAIGVPIALIGIVFGGAFAFGKWNERPFSVFLGAFWAYFYNPHRMIWRRLPSRVRFDKQKANSTTSSPTTVSAELRKNARAHTEDAEEEPQLTDAERLSEIAKLLDN